LNYVRQQSAPILVAPRKAWLVMHFLRSGSLLSIALFTLACGQPEGGGGANGPGPGPCDDPAAPGCEPQLECPAETDPTVHYINHDPDLCEESDCGRQSDCAPCAENQEYFDDECGCGCIDLAPVCPDPNDPTVHYLTDDPAQCGLTDCGGPETDCVPCRVNQEYFQNDCGCGCIDPS
jgi:hypothetical protein